MFKSSINKLILFFCMVKLSLHLFADFYSGFQGDELLHIETGNHLAFGYMEFPPVIGWLAYIQNLFHSSSVWVNHIFTHIASLLIIIILAKTTVALGGKTKAVFLVLLCLLVAPCFGRSQQLFQPVVFSQLFWLLSFYQLVRFVKKPCFKFLFFLTISVAFGCLTKYDMVFFIAGLMSLFFFKHTRVFLLRWPTLIYVFLFIAILLPNFVWQYNYQFPVLKMF